MNRADVDIFMSFSEVGDIADNKMNLICIEDWTI